MTNWNLHGLVVRCDDTDLDAHRAPDAATVDVEVAVAGTGPVLAYGEHRPGRVLAAHDYGEGASFGVVETLSPATGEPTVFIDLHGLAVVRIAGRHSRVELTLADDADPALAPVLLGGVVMSTLLMVRGHPVLHASGVSLSTSAGDVAIAFIGHSGMGKSTMATLLCRDGARLLCDDVLRTDLADGGVLAWPGATATRLRGAAQELGHQSSDKIAHTADGRLSTHLSPAAPLAVPLRALVVPQPDRTADTLSATRLHGTAAVLTLAAFPRLLGWRDPDTTRQAHHHWGALARAVPVVVLRVPWGPPFAPRLGSDAVAAIMAESTGP